MRRLLRLRQPEPDLEFSAVSFRAAPNSRPLAASGGGLQRGAASGLRRIGLPRNRRADFYHRALTLSWPRFLLTAALVYLAANLLFAGLYLLQPGAIAGGTDNEFWNAFFFSVETFATIGYGVISPATRYANFVVTFEALVGIMLVALTTGMMFSRVSRPTARVMFSRVAVVTRANGVPTLMVRMGNERRSQIVQATVSLTLIRNERTEEGDYMRRFYDLRLERENTPVFAMSFQAMHRITEGSPLHGVTPEKLKEWDAEILATVTGLEETMSQAVHARTSYLPHEVLVWHRYADVFGVTPDGDRAIDYRRFHMTEPLAPAPE